MTLVEFNHEYHGEQYSYGIKEYHKEKSCGIIWNAVDIVGSYYHCRLTTGHTGPHEHLKAFDITKSYARWYSDSSQL